MSGPDDPRVEVKLGDAEIGDDVHEVVRDGEKIDQVNVTGGTFTHRFEDRPGRADRRYRVEVATVLKERLVITSHIYVHGVEASGCGCAGGGGGALFAAAPVLLLALRYRRHGGRLGSRRHRER
jgi:uncharacterized protein (TIGR03382 family)